MEDIKNDEEAMVALYKSMLKLSEIANLLMEVSIDRATPFMRSVYAELIDDLRAVITNLSLVGDRYEKIHEDILGFVDEEQK